MAQITRLRPGTIIGGKTGNFSGKTTAGAAKLMRASFLLKKAKATVVVKKSVASGDVL